VLDVDDRYVAHPLGQLFTRTWFRAGQDGADAIVLMHDSLGCVELWRDFPGELCRVTGRTVIAYDRLGFGRSDARKDLPSRDFVLEEATVYVPVLLEALDLQSFIALGHSVGGGMAIECAAHFGARCTGLITMSAQTFVEDRTLRGIRAAQEQFKDPAQVERLARYHAGKARWVLDAWIGRWLNADFADWSLVGTLGKVACPVLAIHGELDEYGSRCHPELIARNCAGPVRVELMPETGHVPYREEPGAVLQMISGFFQPPVA
jgi:pimeloyl-ACP methyl ester carboxylesterase